jgi:hypothetical protein
MHKTQAPTGCLGSKALALSSALNFLSSYQPRPMRPRSEQGACDDPLVPPQERVIETPDGRRLLVAEWGDPGGFPVVSHHGTPGSRLDRHPDERMRLRMTRPSTSPTGWLT